LRDILPEVVKAIRDVDVTVRHDIFMRKAIGSLAKLGLALLLGADRNGENEKGNKE
jgi:hypothetical protein